MATGATRASLEAAPHLDQDWLRDLVETLASIHRPTASQGERVAAEWVAGRLRELGADGEIEVEDVHGTFWWPLGIAAGAGAVAGVAALRGRRMLGAGGGPAGRAGGRARGGAPPRRRGPPGRPPPGGAG
ncbi:MAG: hypothetical protein AABM42_10570, partial [Actinomycetota bacterium]